MYYSTLDKVCWWKASAASGLTMAATDPTWACLLGGLLISKLKSALRGDRVVVEAKCPRKLVDGSSTLPLRDRQHSLVESQFLAYAWGHA